MGLGRKNSQWLLVALGIADKRTINAKKSTGDFAIFCAMTGGLP